MSFLASLPPHGPARDAVILGAIATGNLDTPEWIPVTCGRVTLRVSADYLKIQGARIPMSAPVAQAAADSLRAALPTPKIVQAIEAAARIVAMPVWPGADKLSSARLAWCEEQTGPLSGLVAGHRKDVVVCRAMAARPGRVWIFGARWGNGKRIQPLSGVHEASYADLSHGVRAVLDACEVDGQPALVSELYRDDTLAAWLSDEGPLPVVRYPTASGPPVAISTPTTATWTEPQGAILRRGHRGDAVRELQRLLASRGFVVAQDGLYGPGTESAVREYQEERGLQADGVAGSVTLASLRGRVVGEVEDTDPGAIPFVQARNYYVGRQRPIRLVVLHTAEIAEVGAAAENLAAWASGPNAPMASWHFCIDADATIQCVREEDTAFAAPGANADAIQIEMSGRASQGAAGWADAYSQAVLRRTARLVADLCRRHGLPVAFVDAAGLLRGESGISTHAAVTAAYKKSTHTDPGKDFAMATFLDMVRAG